MKKVFDKPKGFLKKVLNKLSWKKREIFLNKGESLYVFEFSRAFSFKDKPEFLAHFKIFYGEQTRYETTNLSIPNIYRKISDTVIEREALIEEIANNIKIKTTKHIVDMNTLLNLLRFLPMDTLKSFAEDHQSDSDEYEIWDLRSCNENRTVYTALEPIRLVVERRK
jgi:hypothetical protein